jgi:hypothetical protein
MTRLTQPRRSLFTDPEDLRSYDAVTARLSSMTDNPRIDPELEAPPAGDYFGALLNSPRLVAIASQMGTFVRGVGAAPGSYSHADREFVDQVLSADFKTNVVQAFHIPDAVAMGVRLEAIEALRYGHEEDLTEDERLLTRYIRQVVSGTVHDETFSAMVDRLGSRGIVEYTGFILWLQWVIRMMQALDTPNTPDTDVDAIINGLKDGSIPLPDAEAHIK